MAKLLSSLGVVALVALLLSIGCEVSIDINGDDGPTETRDHSFDVGASPILVVSSENGRVDVEAGPAGTIRVQATLRNAPRVRYEAGQNGNVVTVDAEVDRGARNAGADITVTVPPQTVVEIETSNGRIELGGMEASGTLRTSNGRVVMEEVSGDFDVRTSNGPIEVASMVGTGILHTSNGSVSLTDVTGAFDVETSNGPITFSGEMVPGGENRLKTSNGNVTVELQGTPSVNLDASAGNGKVSSELPIEATTTTTEHLVGAIGDGEAELLIRTSNGSVTVE